MLKGEFFHTTPADGAFYSYQIEQSARFDRESSSYLSRTVQSGGNLRKWTFSFWFKMIGSAGFGSNQYYLATTKLSSPYDTLIFDIDSSSRLYYQTNNNYTQLDNAFRDVAGWGHLNIVYDSDNGTAADRRIVYLNGTRLTVESGQTLGQNTDSKFNSNSVHYIGARQDNSASHYGSYYLAEVIWADGQAYAPTQFGETKNGVWIPKDPSGTSFGTTGYHLKFNNDGVGITPSSISSAGTNAATGSNIIGLFGNIGASSAPSNYSQSGQGSLSFTVDLGSAKTVGAWLGQGHQASGYATRTATGTVSHSDNNSDFTSVGSSTYTFGNGVAPNGHTFTPSSHRYWKIEFPSASGGDGSSGYQLSAFYMQSAQSTSIADLGADSSGNDNNFTVNNMGGDHQVLDSPTIGTGS